MVGVPAAGAATTALLFGAGVAIVIVLVVALRGRLRALTLAGAVAAGALLLSLTAVPWIGWRFVEDLRTTTRLDAYERANMGPIQTYLPGYLLEGARPLIPAGASFSVAVGPSSANPLARSAFPALALVTLFPRASAPLDRAHWLLAWGVDPATLRDVTRIRVVHARQGPLPAVLLAERRK